MKVLYGALAAMFVLFAAAMSFATLSVYELQWWWALVAVGILTLMAGVGGVFVPATIKSLHGGELAAGKAALQAFGATCGALFFTMALITWTLGKRDLAPNNAYDTLGLLIFLGFVGVGLQGAMAMISYFLYVRNHKVVAPAREHTPAHHG